MSIAALCVRYLAMESGECLVLAPSSRPEVRPRRRLLTQSGSSETFGRGTPAAAELMFPLPLEPA
jgi:hypothetical protein